MRKNILKLTLTFSLLMLSIACKDDYKTTIPDSTVYIQLYLDSFHQDLQAIGRYRIFTGSYCGYMGVLVYHSGVDEFVAYDIACPADYYTNPYYSSCTVKYNGEEHNILCGCCGNTYNLMTGAANKGNTYKYALRKYKVTKVDNYTFIVQNE